jgi:uncharacterized protein (DUF58 family)
MNLLSNLLYHFDMIIGQRTPKPQTLDALLSPELMRRLDRLDMLSRKIFTGKMPGERRSKKRGRSVEFDDFRQYVPGDDLRHIDWNVFARLDRLFVKLFREEEDLSVVLVLDCSTSMDSGDKSVFCHRLAMAIGYVALVNQNRLSVARFDQAGRVEQLRPVRGRRGIQRLSEFLLASLTIPPPVAGGSPFNDAMRHVSQNQGGKGVAIVLSDFLFEEGWTKGLNDLAHAGGHGFDVTCVQVLSPEELEPGLATSRGLVGDLRLVDVESGRAAEVTLTKSLLKSYERRLSDLRDRLARDCSARAMRYLLARSDADVGSLVLDRLRERGVLG